MDEWKQAAESLNLPWSNREKESVFRRFDADGSGSICFDEFIAALRAESSGLNARRCACVCDRVRSQRLVCVSQA